MMKMETEFTENGPRGQSGAGSVFLWLVITIVLSFTAAYIISPWMKEIYLAHAVSSQIANYLLVIHMIGRWGLLLGSVLVLVRGSYLLGRGRAKYARRWLCGWSVAMLLLILTMAAFVAT